MSVTYWLIDFSFLHVKGSLKQLGCCVYKCSCSCLYCSNMSDALANAVCERCQTRFDPAERIVNSNGELYHENCFVCAQCFRQFPEGLFYEVSSRTVGTDCGKMQGILIFLACLIFSPKHLLLFFWGAFNLIFLSFFSRIPSVTAKAALWVRHIFKSK